MIQRTISLPDREGFFLFGPRGTGKTTLLRQTLPAARTCFIDLLSPMEEDLFARHPEELEQRIAALPPDTEWVVIDEVQKVPRLLDVVHRQIENHGTRFVLTGSSGRKLRRGASNLLAGRVFMRHLHPFTSTELGASFNLDDALQYGTLPRVTQLTSAAEKADFLRTYALVYLKEEIIAEQLVRGVDPFRQFLEVAAQCNGRIVNFSRIAQDVGVDTKTVQSYFSILEDTLVGLLLPAFQRSVRKRQRANPKFYFFDPGVKRALDRTVAVPLVESTYAYADAFEHFLIVEIMRLASYHQPDWRFSYLCTKDDAEIDLIIERPGRALTLVEIKSASRVGEAETRALQRFVTDLQPCAAFCLSRDPHLKRIGAVTCLPWQVGLAELGLPE